jgi:hypothetical protein
MLGSRKMVGSKVAVLAAGVTVASLAAGCTTSPAPAPAFAYAASGYGTSATALGLVNSAPSFLASLGCTTTPGLVRTNAGAAVTLPLVGNVGAITSRATTTGGSTIASNGYENVASVSLLGGLVTAGAVHLASVTSHNSAGFHTSAAATFASLKVLGIPIAASPPPNTVLPLPGIGTITVNEQLRTIGVANAGQVTRGIHIHVNKANLLSLPIGADVVIGQASSGLAGPIGGLIDGTAYGSSLTVSAGGASLNSGPSGLTIMPCRGTNGVTNTRSLAGLTLPGGTSVGAISMTARGTVAKTASSSEMTSSVAGANLLTSLIKVDAVKADAHAGIAGKTKVFSDSGSTLVGLSVKGYGGNLVNVPANTTIAIPGVGTLYLHRVIKTSNAIEVRMIELVVSVGGGALPVGADIRVGVAEASVH